MTAFGKPLGQLLLDFVAQSVPRAVMFSGSFVDNFLQGVRAIFGPKGAVTRERPWVTEDLIAQDFILIYAIVDRHAETE